MSLHCNDVSHWLGAYLDWSLILFCIKCCRWTDNEARAACRTLGFRDGEAAAGSFFPRTTGRMYDGLLGCRQHDNSLLECPRPLRPHMACGHDEEAAVICSKLTAPWWRHQMETFSALPALCVGNSPVIGEFPSQTLVTRSFDAIFDLRLNKRLTKQSLRLVIWDAIAVIMTSL